MLARSHRLLLEIDLLERVSKNSRIISILPRVGYWGTYLLTYFTYLLACLLLDLWNAYSVIFRDILLQHILLYLGIVKKHI